MMTDTDVELALESSGLSTFSDVLQLGLVVIADLDRKLQSLDALLLTGRPHSIADAADAMASAVSSAEPAFQRIVLALEELGTVRLQDAAQQLRRSDQATAATTADHLRSALKQFGRRSDACYRRAQGLGRGLSASLSTLHAFGAVRNGRLIAEA